jgi:hypothetical protein
MEAIELGYLPFSPFSTQSCECLIVNQYRLPLLPKSQPAPDISTPQLGIHLATSTNHGTIGSPRFLVTRRGSMEGGSQRRCNSWKYVGHEYQHEWKWNPRIYARLVALVRAINLNSSLIDGLPTFTEEEIEMLLYSPDQAKLPPIPSAAELSSIEVPWHLPNPFRISIERIYQPNFLTLAQTKYIYNQGGQFIEYVQMQAKVVACRDLVNMGEFFWNSLSEELSKNSSRSTHDPVDSIIALFQAFSRGEGWKMFVQRGAATKVNLFSIDGPRGIGIGPHRRWVILFRGAMIIPSLMLNTFLSADMEPR